MAAVSPAAAAVAAVSDHGEGDVMHCVFCGAPLPERGLVCEYCGKRNPLNLTSLDPVTPAAGTGTDPLTCPLCEAGMDQINVGIAEDILLHRCGACDGVFLSESDLQKVIKHHAGVLHAVDYNMLRYILDHPRNESDTNRVYKDCPVCGETMRKLTYAAVSGVQVDRCLEHGIWLDSGELQQLFEWRSTTISLKRKEIEEERIRAQAGQGKKIRRRKQDNAVHDPFERFLIWVFGAGMV